MTTVHQVTDSRIYYKECRTLALAGYDVWLVVPHDGAVPDGDVRVVSIPVARGRLERMTRTLWRCWRAAAKAGDAVYHMHDPELLAVGLALKLRGRTVVYDAHEDLPRQILAKHWLPPIIRRPIAAAAAVVQWFAGHLVDAVVAATPLIAQRFPPSKTETVQNFPMPEELSASEVLPYDQRPEEVVYVGGLTEIRGIREMIAAVHLVRESVPGVALVLAGLFSPPPLEGEVRRLPGWSQVRYLGWQSRHGVAAVLGRARVGLHVVYPAPNHLASYPVKLFEYMAAGVPVVTSDFALWREIVADAGCGLVVDPMDPSAIAGAVVRLLTRPGEAEAMGQRGRQAVADRYNWGREAAKLLALYVRLTSHARS